MTPVNEDQGCSALCLCCERVHFFSHPILGYDDTFPVCLTWINYLYCERLGDRIGVTLNIFAFELAFNNHLFPQSWHVSSLISTTWFKGTWRVVSALRSVEGMDTLNLESEWRDTVIVVVGLDCVIRTSVCPDLASATNTRILTIKIATRACMLWSVLCGWDLTQI